MRVIYPTVYYSTERSIGEAVVSALVPGSVENGPFVLDWRSDRGAGDDEVGYRPSTHPQERS